MTTRRERERRARLFGAIASYLDEQTTVLEACHAHPGTNSIRPPDVAAEVRRVRRWATQLRQEALRDVAP